MKLSTLAGHPELAPLKSLLTTSTPTHWLATLFVSFLLISLSANTLLNELCFAAGFGCTRMDFGGPDDRFADLIKLSMAFISYEDLKTLLERLPNWDPLYLNYLLDNSYLHKGFTHYHMPPLTTFFLIIIAKFIVIFGPSNVLLGYVLFFIFSLFLINRYFTEKSDQQISDKVALYFMMFFSYPAIFMFIRGNLTSYFTILFLLIYIMTLYRSKYYWLGLIFLALAINIRPNLISLAIIELARHERIFEKLKSLASLMLLTLTIGALSYFATHRLNSAYTVESFLEHVKLYDELYSKGDDGWKNNFSLYGLSKTVRWLMDESPLYNQSAYLLLSLTLATIALALVWLAFKNCLTRLETIFLGVAFTCLFTPVFAFYHMIEFTLPAYVCLRESKNTKKQETSLFPILICAALALSPLCADKPIFYPLFIFSLMIWIIINAFKRNTHSAYS